MFQMLHGVVSFENITSYLNIILLQHDATYDDNDVTYMYLTFWWKWHIDGSTTP